MAEITFDRKARNLHLKLSSDFRDALELSARQLATVEGYSVIGEKHVREAHRFLLRGRLRSRQRQMASNVGNTCMAAFFFGLPFSTPIGGGDWNGVGLVVVAISSVLGVSLLLYAALGE